MAEVSPLSYQTTMPEYPDVSYDAWRKLYGNPDWGGFASNRMFNALTAWANGNPSYSNWRTNLLDQYNAQMNAYNTWLSTGAGQKASAESGDYNPSYFGTGSASASPLSYENINEQPGFSEAGQGIGVILSFINAVQGLATASAKIRQIDLENQGTAIENQYKAALLGNKVSYLGYQNDWLNIRNSTELYSRYKNSPELWKGGVFSPYGGMSYDLRNVGEGLQYQQAAKNLNFLDAGISLRHAQEAMQKWNAKEKKFYTEQMQEIEKDILFNKKRLSDGSIDLQSIRLDLESAARKAGVAGDVVRIILGLVSIFK